MSKWKLIGQHNRVNCILWPERPHRYDHGALEWAILLGWQISDIHGNIAISSNVLNFNTRVQNSVLK
ncbi:hypothetical protein D3C84_462370 [compost metagenome]